MITAPRCRKSFLSGVRRTIHNLSDVPRDTEPVRHASSQGYVELVWTLANGDKARCYEHRLVMGFPDGHVHHKNRDTTDNRLENLEVLEVADHMREHNPLRWSLDEALRLHRSGKSIRSISKSLGVLSTSVLRAFRRRGINTQRSGLK